MNRRTHPPQRSPAPSSRTSLAIVASALFNVGKFGTAAYLGRASVVSVYGAAGSLVMVLL